jgi:hypothetical protein
MEEMTMGILETLSGIWRKPAPGAGSAFALWLEEQGIKTVNCGANLNTGATLFRATTTEDAKTFIKAQKITFVFRVSPNYYAVDCANRGICVKDG